MRRETELLLELQELLRGWGVGLGGVVKICHVTMLKRSTTLIRVPLGTH